MNDHDQSQYAGEVQERWGDTEAYKESARRTKKYTDDDHARINAAQDTIEAGLADMYTADERFKAHYETRAEGLAEYVASAIKANAARQGEPA